MNKMVLTVVMMMVMMMIMMMTMTRRGPQIALAPAAPVQEGRARVPLLVARVPTVAPVPL